MTQTLKPSIFHIDPLSTLDDPLAGESGKEVAKATAGLLKKMAEEHPINFIIVDYDESKRQRRLVLRTVGTYNVAKKREVGPINSTITFTNREQAASDMPSKH